MQDIIVSACDIRERYNFSYYDSLIVSAAINSKCNKLYSEDMQDRLMIEDLMIINPFKGHL